MQDIIMIIAEKVFKHGLLLYLNVYKHGTHCQLSQPVYSSPPGILVKIIPIFIVLGSDIVKIILLTFFTGRNRIIALPTFLGWPRWPIACWWKWIVWTSRVEVKIPLSIRTTGLRYKFWFNHGRLHGPSGGWVLVAFWWGINQLIHQSINQSIKFICSQ